MRVKIKQITPNDIEKEIIIKGWIKSARSSKNWSFININDGSQFSGLQIIAENTIENYEKILPQLTTGAAISVTGKLVESPSKGQSFELQATKIEVIGACDGKTYPLQKKRHSFEFLRTIAHLRPRTNTIGAVARVRNALAFATHKFINEKGFLYIHTPIITSADCEGAGEMFKVTILDIATPPKTTDGKVEYAQDFFEKQPFLTVSTQLV